MMSLLPLLYLAEEENRQKERRWTSPQTEARKSDLPKNVALDKALLHLLETGRFSDVQFLVGVNEYCFNCHIAIVGGRSEVLATAMEQRWAGNNVILNKTVVRLPETDVEAFKVFIRYIYSDGLNLETSDGHFISQIDLLLKVMSLSHMYQVDGLLKECVTQLTTKINVTTCWIIYNGSRLIAPSLSDCSFQYLCDNIHEAAARNEYLKWDGETVRRILSLERSFISELNLSTALFNWQKFDPQRKDIFESTLLPLIRFPTMNLVAFTKVIRTNILPQSEARRLRRFITNTNPRRRNTSIFSSVPRYVDIYEFKLLPYQHNNRTTACSEDGWNSSDDNFMELIDSHRAEFSIETNCPTTISTLMLQNVRKWNSSTRQCPFNLLITFHIYIGQSVMHKEEKSFIIGGRSVAGPSIPFVLRQPFQMNPGKVYEFHVLYTLLEDNEAMVDLDATYEYEVTWSSLSPLHKSIARRIGHGIIFKINYRIEDEDEDAVDHEKTPRWIHSVHFKSDVSRNSQQLCSVS